MNPETYVSEFMSGLRDRNSAQPEFHQAVEEFVGSIAPFLLDHKHYLDHKVLERLTEPDRVISFRVAWQDDKGGIQVNRGYRIQFNNAIGPYKGGLRFHPTVNEGVLKFLAFEQIFKNSLTTLPMGGGKGGSNFNPKGKSDNEVMRFCQAFMSELSKYIGPNIDVPAGDIGVGGREIGYLFGQYKRLQNEFTGILTGKPIPFGGSLIRTEATGYGCAYFVENMLNEKDDSIKDKKCIVSGSGNVAQYTVEKIQQLGGTAYTMSDSGGYIYDPDGISEEKLDFVKQLKNEKRGRISEYADKYKNAKYHDGERPWSVECDIAFPSATQNEINGAEARQLIKNGCIAVGEGANMPSDLEAIKTYLDAKILYAPSKAANAGGVAVSGLEMSQNSLRLAWSAEEVEDRLKNIMQSIHSQCVEYGRESSDYINYVKGANIAGFVKVADATIAQGVG